MTWIIALNLAAWIALACAALWQRGPEASLRSRYFDLNRTTTPTEPR